MPLREKILVLGAGRLAESVMGFFSNVVVLPKESCDITDRTAVERAIRTIGPDIVLNTAAITRPTLCEDQHGLAWRVNVYGARNVAAACASARVRSVHISSNWATDPVNEYGRTKLVSEVVGFDLVLRTCYYDESYWVLAALTRGEIVSLVETDQFNPISVVGLLQVLEKLLERRVSGIVNVGVMDRLSHYDFGVMLARTFEMPVDLVRPIATVSTPYEYPYNTYLEVHPQSRIGVVEDMGAFRDALAWRYDGADAAASDSVPDMRSEDERDSGLRDDATSGRFR